MKKKTWKKNRTKQQHKREKNKVNYRDNICNIRQKLLPLTNLTFQAFFIVLPFYIFWSWLYHACIILYSSKEGSWSHLTLGNNHYRWMLLFINPANPRPLPPQHTHKKRSTTYLTFSLTKDYLCMKFDHSAKLDCMLPLLTAFSTDIQLSVLRGIKTLYKGLQHQHCSHHCHPLEV